LSAQSKQQLAANVPDESLARVRGEIKAATEDHSLSETAVFPVIQYFELTCCQ